MDRPLESTRRVANRRTLRFIGLAGVLLLPFIWRIFT